MDGASREALHEQLEEALANDDAQALRERVGGDVAARLTENGLRLSIHHQLSGDAAGIGFATASEMAGELAQGAQRLFSSGLWYPGAALVRQLIECGYLLTLMSERRAEAETWFGSSRDQILAKFMPRHMRRRSARGFRGFGVSGSLRLGRPSQSSRARVAASPR